MYDANDDAEFDWNQQVIASIREGDDWQDLESQADSISDYADEDCPAAQAALAEIRERQSEMEDPEGEYFNEEAAAMYEADAESNDPYGWRGLSREDF